MDRIATASSLLIETQPEGWRLLLNGTTNRTLFEAKRGEPVRYAEVFGTRRKLPLDGVLPLESIDRVVLGWSAKDEAWHLGLVLRPPMSEERGSRWCELAHWIDPKRDTYESTAIAVGEALGAQVERPFILIPPAVQEAPPIPLPALPLHFDLWTLKQNDETRYEFVRAGKWARSNWTRALWYLLWMVAFLVLSITSVTSGIAFPRPELLVPAGFVCALVLLVIAVAQIARTLLRPNRIVIAADAIRWMRGGATTKTIPLADVKSVYVSHVVSTPKRRKPQDGEIGTKRREVHYGEMNLDLQDGKFLHIVGHGTTDELIPATEDAADNAVQPLTPDKRHTHLQAAGWMIAERLRVPIYYDQRER